MIYPVMIIYTGSPYFQSLICSIKIHRAAQILNVSSTHLMTWLDFSCSLPPFCKCASQSLSNISGVSASG